MKKLLLILFFTYICLPKNASAQYDTLRHYDVKSSRSYTSLTDVLAQIARFEPPGPGSVVSIILGLDGPANASVKMHLFGHDGGTAFPQLEKDIITPITVNKTKAGFERITVALPQPVYLANNQFFISVDEFKNGAKLAYDSKIKAYTCKSTDGGNYRYMYFKRNQASQLYPHSWSEGLGAFMIDVIMQYAYPEGRAPDFRDVTFEAGIDTNLSNRSIAWADYNRDGFLDLLVSGKLYKNNGNGTFTDVTTEHNISGAPTANLFLDMNNDGLLDILFIGGTNTLYIQSSQNTFSQQTLSLPQFKAISSFSVADINNDGFPDIFIGQLWSTYPDAEPNYLFINNKQNDFSDASYMLYDVGAEPRRSRGSRFVDFDNDGDLDLYVTNYFLESDEFYRNNGDGTFTDIIAEKNIDRNQTGSNHGTGVDWADYDADGDMDLLLPQFAHPWGIQKYDHRGTTIYKNTGAPNYNFEDQAGKHGIEYEETHAGASWGDVNNDGLMDFIITTYYGCRYIDLYIQRADNTFDLRTYEYGLQDIVTGEDAVWVDYNNDGQMDLACGKGYRFRLFSKKAVNNNFVEVDLKSLTGNSTAVGAKVLAYYNGKPHMQDVRIGHGQRMQDPLRLHFGLGSNNKIDSLVVFWPGEKQKKEIYTNLRAGTIYSIEEGGKINPPVTNLKDQKLLIHPNPASGKMYISLKLDEASDVQMEIVSPEGKILYSKNLGQLKQGEQTLDFDASVLKREADGAKLYLLRLKTNKEELTGRFIYKP